MKLRVVDGVDGAEDILNSPVEAVRVDLVDGALLQHDGARKGLHRVRRGSGRNYTPPAAVFRVGVSLAVNEAVIVLADAIGRMRFQNGAGGSCYGVVAGKHNPIRARQKFDTGESGRRLAAESLRFAYEDPGEGFRWRPVFGSSVTSGCGKGSSAERESYDND
jgi:hypothetical protein